MNTRTRCEFDQLSVERYAFANGRRPRGTGMWMFDLGRNGAWTTFQTHGSFSQAKADAMREARSLGCNTVELLP
jgi:hypothetical protein